MYAAAAKIPQSMSAQLEDWAKVVSVVATSDPRLLIQRGFPDDYAARIEALCSAANTQAYQELSFNDDNDYYTEMGRMRDLSGALDEIMGLIPRLDGKIRRTFDGTLLF
jgi:hypothetical protein